MTASRPAPGCATTARRQGVAGGRAGTADFFTVALALMGAQGSYRSPPARPSSRPFNSSGTLRGAELPSAPPQVSSFPGPIPDSTPQKGGRRYAQRAGNEWETGETLRGPMSALLDVRNLHTEFRTGAGLVRAVDGLVYTVDARGKTSVRPWARQAGRANRSAQCDPAPHSRSAGTCGRKPDPVRRPRPVAPLRSRNAGNSRPPDVGPRPGARPSREILRLERPWTKSIASSSARG